MTMAVPGWDLPDSPFHSGEHAVQTRIGVRDRIEVQARRSLRRFMPDQHREFYAALPYAFVGSVDAAGQPWASMVFGPPGFLSTPDAVTLRVDAGPVAGDPLAGNLRDGAELAVLGVELPTRRRNRAIGTASDVGPEGFTLNVRQTSGLCAKYIQSRTIEPLPAVPAGRVHRSLGLDAAMRSIVARADTLFVATADMRADDPLTRGADISHRGGRTGFVRIDGAHGLTMPDYTGNFMFNTLGNLTVEPRAGLLFPDFDSGDLLFLAAHAEIVWDGPEVAEFEGAQRLLRFTIDQAIRVEAGLGVRFSAPVFARQFERG